MSEETTQKGNNKSWWRWIIRFFGIILLLLIVAALLFTIPSVQQRALKWSEKKIEETTHTQVDIGSISLNLFKGLVLDQLTAYDRAGDTLLHIGQINTSLEDWLFTLIHNELNISKLEISDADFYIYQSADSTANNLAFLSEIFQPKEKDTLAVKKPFYLNLRELEIHNIHFNQRDELAGSDLDIFIPYGRASVDTVDLERSLFWLSEIKLESPQFIMNTWATPRVNSKKDFMLDLPFIHTDQLVLNNGIVIFDNNRNSKTRAKPYNSIDFNHMVINEIGIDFENVTADGRKFWGRVSNLKAKEQSGFELKSLKSDSVYFSERRLALLGVELKTPQSVLQDTVILKFRQWEDFTDFSNKVLLDVRFKGTTVGVDDLQYFSRSLRKNNFFSLNKGEKISLQGMISGKVNSLKTRGFSMSLGNRLSLKGDLSSRNLLDPEQTYLDLELTKLHTTIRTLKELIPNIKVPDNFDKLGTLDFKGRFTGFYYQFVLFGDLSTNVGRGVLDLGLNTKDGVNKEKYNGQVQLFNFDLGQWSGNPDFGKFSFKGRVDNGVAFTLPYARANLDAVVNSFQFKGYDYRNVTLNGKLQENLFAGRFEIEDPNINFNFDGTVDLSDSIPLFDIQSDIKQLDLKQLNLVDESYVLSGHIDLEMKGSNFDNFLGEVAVNGFDIAGPYTKLHLDSLHVLNKVDSMGQKTFTARSEALNAQITGLYDLTQLQLAFLHYFQRLSPGWYDQLGLKSEWIKEDLEHQQFKYTLDATRADKLLGFVGVHIDTIKRVSLKGWIDDYSDTLALIAQIDSISLGQIMIEEVQSDFNGSSDEMTIYSYIGVTQLNPNTILAPTESFAEFSQDTVNFQIEAKALTTVLRNIMIKGTIQQYKDIFELQLLPSNFMLFKNNWALDKDNFFRFGHGRLSAGNVHMTSGDMDIQVTTPSERALDIAFKDFNVALLNDFVGMPNIQLSGPVNANVHIDDFFDLKGLSANAFSKALLINNEQNMGTLNLDAEMADLTVPLFYHAAFERSDYSMLSDGYINFNKEDSEIDGVRYARKSMNLHQKLNDFPLSFIENIIPTGISNTQGQTVGYFDVSGPINNPAIDGAVTIFNGQTTVDYLGCTYTFDDQSIILDSLNIRTDSITIKDKYGNEALVNGGISHNRFKSFGLDVHLTSKEFLLIDTEEGDNDMFYGHILAEAAVDFTGAMNSPNIDVVGKTLPTTKVFMPLNNGTAVGDLRYINFVQSDTLVEESDKLLGVSISLDLLATPDADIQLILDKKSGDIMKGRGTGNLQIVYSKAGEFTLDGNYVIDKGQYLFTMLNVVNKPFVVEKGSSISFSGDPTNATLDVRAKYENLTAPVYQLIADNITNSSDEVEANKATEIDLTMLLTGKMVQPDIQFIIDIPNLTSGNVKNMVTTKLKELNNDPNELSRQVFGLIVLGTFLPTGNSFASIQGNNLTYVTGINTVTEFLSSQFTLYLNSLLSEVVGTSKLLNGIQIAVDYNVYQDLSGSDIIGGTNSSEFVFKLSNQFFNNRLTVQVGGNLYSNNVFASAADFSADIVVELTITKDRRFRLRAYNSNEPDILGARRDKRGLGFTYRREFDNLKELFTTQKAKNKEDEL